MARAFSWPAADREGAGFPSPGLPDPESFAASIGPELSRLFGLRTAARAPATTDSPPAAILVAALLPAPGSKRTEALELLMPEADLALLMDLLFGGREGDAPERLPPLPPSSASWMALSGFLAIAASRSLAAIGLPCGEPAHIPPRPKPAEGQAARLWLVADFEGMAVRLGLRLQAPQPVLPDPPGRDPLLWRRRTRERALGVTIPVSLRIAERRMPMGEVARLGAGAILPLDRPEHVEVLVGGQPFARIASSQFIPPACGEEENT